MYDHRQLVREAIPKQGLGLDIGCRSTNSKIGRYGCDIHRDPSVDFICNGNNLSIKRDSLDYIVACHVIEHMTNPKATLIEWIKALKVGGSLYIITPDAEKDLKHSVLYWEHPTWFTPNILRVLVGTWLHQDIFHFETRSDLTCGSMIFCYSYKLDNFTIPRLPPI